MKRKSDYERDRQRPPDVDLEADERILFHESREDAALTIPNLILGFLLILGFPFYAMIIILGGGGLISGASPDEIWPMVQGPLAFLSFETMVLAVAVPLAKEKIVALIPTNNHLIITNKRIFSVASNLFLPNEAPLLTQESRFSDVVFLATEQKKNYSILKVKIKKANPSDDESREQSHVYTASNASLAYSFIPCEITLRKGPKSIAGSKEMEQSKREGIMARGIMGFVLCLMLAFGSCIFLQESTSKYLVESREAYIRKDYAQAEACAQNAYDRISKIPFHGYYGPACYRLAIAYVANGKPDAAISLFKEAGDRCSKDEDIDWRPAKFRSHAQLARIFQSRGDINQSEHFYQRALAEVALEPEKRRVVEICNQYTDFLKTQGKAREVDSVLAIADKAVDKPHAGVFRE